MADGSAWPEQRMAPCMGSILPLLRFTAEHLSYFMPGSCLKRTPIKSCMHASTRTPTSKHRKTTLMDTREGGHVPVSLFSLDERDLTVMR